MKECGAGGWAAIGGSRLQVVADAVQFLDQPKKVANPDGAVAEPASKPADRPAVGGYRRKAG